MWLCQCVCVFAYFICRCMPCVYWCGKLMTMTIEPSTLWPYQIELRYLCYWANFQLTMQYSQKHYTTSTVCIYIHCIYCLCMVKCCIRSMLCCCVHFRRGGDVVSHQSAANLNHMHNNKSWKMGTHSLCAHIWPLWLATLIGFKPISHLPLCNCSGEGNFTKIGNVSRSCICWVSKLVLVRKYVRMLHISSHSKYA